MTEPTIRNIPWYGWKRDIPDQRDYKFIRSIPLTAIAPIYDPRTNSWGVYDQGQIGSCTANSTLSSFRQLLIREGHGDFNGSRLAQYYWSRYIEGTTKQDAGAEIRDAVKVLTRWGVAPETDWPYNIAKLTVGPPKKVGDDAKKHTALQYHSVAQTQADICAAVVQNGNVIIGFTVYDSFESDAVAANGIVPMPKSTENVLGGHAVHVVGYDLSKNWFIVKNSWGVGWGDKGYFYMPIPYLTNPNLSGDFWTLSLVK